MLFELKGIILSFYNLIFYLPVKTKHFGCRLQMVDGTVVVSLTCTVGALWSSEDYRR